MDQVYARIKRLKKAPFRKVVSGETLFDLNVPEPGSCAEYDPSTILDDDEWYKISDFKERDFCLDVLRDDLTSADVPELVKEEFEKISYVMSVQGEQFFFQRVRPSSFLRRKTITFGDAATLQKPSNRIVINSQPDAVYTSDYDVLIFRNLAAISPIFTGIDTLYKEATDAEVQSFLDLEFIDTTLQTAEVSKPNRKRIALALDTLKNMSPSERDSVLSYIDVYRAEGLVFDSSRGVFTVANDDELKTLVYGIEQRFYTTIVGAEKRLANSVVKI